MQTTLEATTVDSASAPRAASANWAGNLRGLANTQPRLFGRDPLLPTDVEWVFARDGYLTALDGKTWWSGCSLPRRAAEFMLRTMDASAPVACLLNPAHAAQVRVALDKLQRPQAVIVLVPDLRAQRILLACDDFSDEIIHHRLWFASGERWEEELRELLETYPGLPTPQQFVRPFSADSSLTDSLVGPAQRIFADVSVRRAELVRTAREGWTPRVDRAAHRRLCVVAPSHFRLWDDAGHALRTMLCDDSGTSELAIAFDPDDPTSASPVALAQAAAQCDAIVTPNSGRADVPDVVPLDMPWVTWVTTPRIPSAERRGARDVLVLADPAWQRRAVAAGWPRDRIAVAAWPDASPSSNDARPLNATPFIAMICDTRSLDAPAAVLEYSSQSTLWDAVREELLADPFQLTDPDAYLADRMRRMQIPPDGLNATLFVDALIVPAYQQGLCRVLHSAGLPVQCYGRTWSDLSELSPIAKGPIHSREHLREIAGSACALIHPEPFRGLHPVETLGCRVIASRGSRSEFMNDARKCLANTIPCRPTKRSIAPQFSRAAVLNLLVNA